VSVLDLPVRTAEFLAVDTETNGRAGDDCEVTEIGAVLVGGGELHDAWSSLARPVVPLGRGIQRFTGITQAMVDGAPPPREVLPELAARLEGRVLLAHSASFDRRVLVQAFERCDLSWPDPPVLCTVALARRLLPLQRRRGLRALAEALGIEVVESHRARPDAETCARVFCALFPRLCSHAATVGEAMALLRARREPRSRAPRRGRPAGARRARPELDFGELPRDPGVYLFRDASGRVLYVGKSVSIRSRARAHFAPSDGGGAWTAQAEVVDYEPTHSELGALLLESRLVKELRPPGNARLRPDGRLAYLTCRLEAPFPVLEVASEPASGHAVSVGPVRGRRALAELAAFPSAYGQMGRCLSPCLGDLDPNLYRRRVDAALAIFEADGRRLLLDHVEAQMRTAAGELAFERATALRRRLGRLRTLLDRLEGPLRAAHADPRLVLARHPVADRWDGAWLAGGRVAWGPVADPAELVARTREAAGRASAPGVPHVPPPEVDAVRIASSWLSSHPEAPTLALRPAPSTDELVRFVEAARSQSIRRARAQIT
jgi:DNA polymerase-3 subunit epsilon